MQTIEYCTVDKSSWPRGPWDNEPDKKQWQDPATGLPCLAKRNPHSGFWCGYVGVAEDHPSHGKHYDALLDIDTHGGLTYADACEPGADEARGICHKPDAGEPAHVWWFGFDCGHVGDYGPKADWTWCDGAYRDLAYVEREVTELARQLHALASPAPLSAGLSATVLP